MHHRRLLFLALLVGSLPSLLLGQTESAQTFEKDGRYLAQCREALQKYHLEGKSFKTARLVSGTARGVASELERTAGDRRDLSGLAAWLRKQASAGAFPSMKVLFEVLGKFSERVERLPGKIVLKGAEIGLIRATGDPFSKIVDLKTMQGLMRTLGSGEDRSFGLALRKKNGQYRIAHVRYGSPGYRWGLAAGDQIRQVNGIDPLQLKPNALSELFKNADVGTRLELTVFRKGWRAAHRISLIKKTTQPPRVIRRMLPGKIGYIRLTMFDLRGASQMAKALELLTEQGMRALVLDLRNNPGGALPTCVKIAEQFLAGKHLITRIESRHPSMGNRSYHARGGKYHRVPLTVLINKSSASASELLAGALQDLGRATVVGKTTYGKGIGQSVIPLPGPRGKFLYLTVMRYYLPKGKSVHRVGVAPDHDVALPRLDSATSEKLIQLRISGAVSRYVTAHNRTHPKALARIGGYATVPLARFPGYARELRPLLERLPAPLLALEIRRTIRQTLRGEFPPCDPVRDSQFRKAVQLVATKAGIALDSIPAYESFGR